MKQPLRVLIVEDSEEDAFLLLRELRCDYDLFSKRVDTPASMRVALVRQVWDIVLSDYSLQLHYEGLSGAASSRYSARDARSRSAPGAPADRAGPPRERVALARKVREVLNV
jgi:hypothetical protein